MSERPTLELSADQVQADGGAFLITMPGDRVLNPTPDGMRARREDIVPSPPSVLVALNQPCPTCDGAGCDIDHCQACGDEYTEPCDRHEDHPHWELGCEDEPCCPDCGGSGRLVFDLKTPCEWCTEPPGWLLGEPDHYERGTDAWVPCECNPDEADPGPGSVSYRVWLDPEWGILPTTECVGAFADIWDNLPQPSILWKPDNVYGVGPKLLNGNALTPIVLPPAARPGDYVARAVKVTA